MNGFDQLLAEVAVQPTRLQQVKKQIGIETLDSGGAGDPLRWMAVLMAPCRRMGYGVTQDSDVIDIITKVGRLVDEGGFAGYGATEADAVVEVCRLNKIPVVL